MKKLMFIVLVVLTLFGCQPNGSAVLDTPSNIRREGSRLLFDEVEHATHYVIEINGETTTVTNYYYDFVETGELSVRVKAQAEGYQDSLYSQVYVFVLSNELKDVSYNYSVFSTFDLTIYQFNEDVTIDSLSRSTGVIAESNYTYVNRKLTLNSAFLKVLSKGEHVITVTVADLGSFDVTITMNDVGFPYIVTDPSILFIGEDVTVIYALYEEDLYDSDIISITGDGLTEDDYEINENRLTISSTFISSYFQENTTKNALLIKFTLSHPITNVNGFLFIKRPTES